MPVVSKVCNPRIACISKIQPSAELLPNSIVLVANNIHFHPRCTLRIMTA
jgi:hypothetical protein